eukprot:360578-Chlamydomonas_euryale.AAC.5
MAQGSAAWCPACIIRIMEEDADVDEDVARVLEGTDGDPDRIRENQLYMQCVILHDAYRTPAIADASGASAKRPVCDTGRRTSSTKDSVSTSQPLQALDMDAAGRGSQLTRAGRITDEFVTWCRFCERRSSLRAV